MHNGMDFVRLYIDPATGSMLFSVLLGVFITVGFFFRTLLIKLKIFITGAFASVEELIVETYHSFTECLND